MRTLAKGIFLGDGAGLSSGVHEVTRLPRAKNIPRKKAKNLMFNS
jgi:hypothetical protein